MSWRNIRNVIASTWLLLLVGGAVSRLPAVTVGFSQLDYNASPGQTLDLTVNFSESVPNGLEGYALKLTFPGGLLAINQITPAPELDFGLVTPPADRDAGFDFASVAGFVELGEPAYTGIDFVTFNVTVSAAAADGAYGLVLGLLDPEANNFVDGTGSVIDGDLVFGTATLNISSIVAGIDDFRIGLAGGQLAIRFAGTPGFDYLIEYSTDMTADSWLTLTAVTAPGDGQVEVLDAIPSSGDRRFYRVTPL